MDRKMNIEQALHELGKQPIENVLVARFPPFTPSSEATFVSFTAEVVIPEEVSAQGYEYLLEVEEIQFLLQGISKKKMSRSAIAEYVIHYAVYDAYPSWISDVPSTS
jgi:hypothetical protein